ncbi:unnamed protein product [Miscanthus lutarioriparius]|uniref:N-acetyltransferase domain-containing protein n=1 Tax=Miscanthus lutarioriparius TaxID=422564 RepID=A0A811MC65_9POAL|nr:unnamed protein product [Miscanthus lutarioriparius]
MEASEAAPAAAAAAAVEAEDVSGGKGSWYVLGERALMVPYMRQHVPRYHDWMQDPALLEATASEPLSLSQEFEDMTVFISFGPNDNNMMLSYTCLLAVDGFARSSIMPMSFMTSISPRFEAGTRDSGWAAIRRLLVGMNAFGCSGSGTASSGDGTFRRIFAIAEIEIMIAEHKSRGKGIGQEAILLMMAFAVEKYGIHTFRAKISESNTASLKLFRKLGFKDASYSAVFKEVTLEAAADSLPLRFPLTIGDW